MNGVVWAGVDIGGTKTAVLVSATIPQVLERIEFPTLPAQGPDQAVRQIVSGISECLARRGVQRSALRGIGVSCGSPLDRISGTVQAPPNLPTWVDVPIASILRNEFGAECRLENDANAGAVAEHRFGAGQGTQDMVFLTMGTGLGAGIIAGGRLLHGASDAAGEIGHVRLTAKGPVGYHKAGSVEGWASGGGIAQVAAASVAAAVAKGRKTALAEQSSRGQAITARDVATAATAGDALARTIIRNTGKKLGEALSILIDVLNPECIVIGGIAMRLGEAVLGPAREIIAKEALSQSSSVCRIVPAVLDEHIGDVAALCIAEGMEF